MQKGRVLAFAFVAAVVAAAAWAESYEAVFVKALAGDRVVVRHDGKDEIVRVWGVACPMKKQPYSRKALEFTRNMLYHKSFVVKPIGKDDAGSPLVEIVFKEGPNLSQELVRKGLAWADPKQFDGTLKAMEKQARDAGEGLWSKSNPMPPWEFEKSNP